MWPLLLDMTREESKRVLRRLELEAYSAVISVFRAQGDLTKDKKKQLQELQNTLSISTERHRAEVRRAVNDEKLTTIADNTFGPETSSEWLIEGRRLVPLMPRLVPQTAFTLTANQAANFQAERNAALPTPSLTGNKDLSSPPVVTTPTMTPTAVAKMPRPGSPSSNVVVLPSGVSVHIKDEVDEIQTRKRRRSHSAEGVALGGDSGLPHPRVSYTTQTSTSPSPMKITISKSPQTKTQSSLTNTPPQKVILLSSSGQSTAANILQKSMSVPVVRAAAGSSTTYSSGVPKTSIIYPGSSTSPASNGNLGNIVTVATTSALQNVSTSGASSQVYAQQQGGSIGFATPTGALTKPRMKTVTRRLATGVTSLAGQRPGLVVPMVPQSVHGLSHPSHIKTLGKPTIQIKQEGGMKIITQTLPTSSKLLPKPSTLGSSGTPIVVVSSSSQVNTSGPVTMVTRPMTSSGVSASLGSKILNITTQGGKVIATTNKSPNVVTVNPKTLHLTAVKTAAGVAGGKPNVIVVQKSQGKKVIGQGATMMTTKAGTSIPFDKELVSFIQKHDPQKIVTAKTLDNKVILTTSAQDFSALKKSRSDTEGKTSLLAELIQAASAGMATDSPTSSSLSSSPIIIEESSSSGETTTQSNLPIKAVTPVLPPNLTNEWFEYDVGDHIPASSLSTQPKPADDRPPSVDLTLEPSSTDQLSQDQFYTLEQAMRLVNPAPSSKVTSETEGVSLLETTATMDATGADQSQQILKGRTGSEAEIKESLTKFGSLTAMVPGLTPDLLQGDLDPQTGIFHSSGSGSTESANDDKTATTQSMDLLSTSLAQAQIDLDPYQFMDDDMVSLALTDQEVKVAAQPVGLDPTKPGGQRSQKEAFVSILTGNVVQDSKMKELETSAGVESQVIHMPSSELSNPTSRAPSSFIPLEELTNKPAGASINVTTKAPSLAGGDNSSVTVTMLPKGLDPGALTLEDLTSQRLEASEEVISPPSPEIEIGTSESSELIGSQSTVSEFSSQGFLGEQGGVSETGNLSDGGQSDSSLPRASKRRRKPTSTYDDPPVPSSTGSWMRAALGILNKVSKVRGSNKDKSDFDASSWFLYPVDPEDAPDYFTIIKNPMDFSTIKKKLESCQYSDFEEFHADMLLVSENCNTYNPPGHQAREDCLEVFGIYQQEYSRLTDKWHKTHISSPVSKKMKLDKSPGKS